MYMTLLMIRFNLQLATSKFSKNSSNCILLISNKKDKIPILMSLSICYFSFGEGWHEAPSHATISANPRNKFIGYSAQRLHK